MDSQDSVDEKKEERVYQAEKISETLQSPGGKLLLGLIEDQIVLCTNQLASPGVTESFELARLVGGVRFGEDLLRRIMGKINLGRILRERKKEVEVTNLKNRERTREKYRPPRPEDFSRDSLAST